MEVASNRVFEPQLSEELKGLSLQFVLVRLHAQIGQQGLSFGIDV
jgi:hypothetical protein